MTKTLFGKIDFSDIKTQGIKYAGSKLKIIPYILDIISELEVKTVLDGFSGSTRVSQAFAQAGYNVFSNDISDWSEVCAKCFLLHNKDKKYYQKIINDLNKLEGYDGWFSEYYGGDEDEFKKPFQKKNTRKLDAIRDKIDELNLDEIDKSVVLTSLLFALDSVDSTLGHFSSYLSRWSNRSYNDLILKVPDIKQTIGKHKITKRDIFDIVDTNQNFDLAYFDPPYGSNNEKMPPSRVRYSAYYHIWTTVVKNDKPSVFGKVNRREDTRDLTSSVFEEFRKDTDGSFLAMKAIKNMIQKTKAKYILLSYSSGGRATKQELMDIIDESGKLLKIVEIDYKKNIMSNMSWTNEWVNSDKTHKEYLFLMEKIPTISYVTCFNKSDRKITSIV